MAWSTPLTAVSNVALTAAQWNASVRDNLLESPSAKVTVASQYIVSTGPNATTARTLQVSSVSSATTFGSTSYGAPADAAGPAVTVTTGTMALVIVSARLSGSTFTDAFASYAVSGVTTDAAADNRAFQATIESTKSYRGSAAIVHSLLTAGSNIFTTQYRSTLATATVSTRQMNVLPF